MAGEPDGGTPRGRAIAATLLHSAAGTAVLLVAHYEAPLDRPLDAATGLLFLGALLLFTAFMAFELWSIIRSEQPRLRAIRALGVGLPLPLVIFGGTYCTIAAQQTGAFSEPLNRTDGLYFTVTVFGAVQLAVVRRGRMPDRTGDEPARQH